MTDSVEPPTIASQLVSGRESTDHVAWKNSDKTKALQAAVLAYGKTHSPSLAMYFIDGEGRGSNLAATEFLHKVSGFLDNGDGRAFEQAINAAGELIVRMDSVTDKRQFLSVLSQEYGLPASIRENMNMALNARDRFC